MKLLPPATLVCGLLTLSVSTSALAQSASSRPDAGTSPALSNASDAGVTAGASAAADPIVGFDALLRSTVSAAGVNYPAIRTRIATLRAYTGWLATHGPSTTASAFRTASDRKAYWINAYNAFVLLSVAEAPASMRNVVTYLPSNGFFRARRHRVDGRDITLDEIENRQIREVFHDARVHMALNCGARSCPPLRPGIFHATTLDRELNQQASSYVNASANVSVDPAAHTVRVSQLFEWFAADFGTPIAGRAAVAVTGPMMFLYSFANASLRARLVAGCGPNGTLCRIEHTTYNWELNASR